MWYVIALGIAAGGFLTIFVWDSPWAFLVAFVGWGAEILVLFWKEPTLIAQRRALHGQCEHCGYNLKGNISGTCPECGNRIEQRGDRKSHTSDTDLR